MGLCGTLLILYVTFIITNVVDRRQGFIEVSPYHCRIIAGFLHFFILSALCWVAVEGLNMLSVIETELSRYISRFMCDDVLLCATIYKAGGVAVCAWGEWEQYYLTAKFSPGLKDLLNANACWLVLIYNTLIITYVANIISKYVPYIL